jgi:hypothetical protein
MSRSSRTSASSGVLHTTGSTCSASPTISAIRVRVSLAVKYWRTRPRRLVLLPT